MKSVVPGNYLLSKLLLYLDQNDAVLDVRGEKMRAHAGFMRRAAGFGIEGPCMPWANDAIVLDNALADGATAMRANIVHDNKFPMDARDTKDAACRFHLADFAILWGFIETAQRHELRHSRASPRKSTVRNFSHPFMRLLKHRNGLSAAGPLDTIRRNALRSESGWQRRQKRSQPGRGQSANPFGAPTADAR